MIIERRRRMPECGASVLNWVDIGVPCFVTRRSDRRAVTSGCSFEPEISLVHYITLVGATGGCLTHVDSVVRADVPLPHA
jgi:hypothetical protein